MPRTVSTLLTCLALTVLALGAPATADAGDPAAEAPPPNVRLTLAVGPGGEAVEATTYSMLCAGDGSPCRLSAGKRVPVPTVTSNAATSGEGRAVPIVSFQYQEVGLQASLQTTVLADGRIQLRGEVERSAAAPSPHRVAGLDLPEIAFLHHRVGGILEEGVPTTIAAQGGGGEGLEVEVTAEIVE